jgi:hypothetical protein
MPTALDGANVVDERRDGKLQVATAPVAIDAGSHGVLLSDAPDVPPQQFVASGLSLVIVMAPTVPASVARWLAMEPSQPTLATCGSIVIQAVAGREHLLTQQVSEALTRNSVASIIVNFSTLTNGNAMVVYLESIGRWLAAQPIDLVSPQALAAALSKQLLEAA